MEWLREQAIERIRHLLGAAGFFVSDAHSIRPTSFDLMARRDSLLLILKLLKNIDALDPEEARRLRDLGGLFPAAILVIGQTSGTTELDAGVVYNRYGVPVVSEESLRDLVEKGVPPFLVSSPGGIFARVDGPRLRALREARALSLGALASVAGVSRRTIQLYEDGAGAEVAVVERLEEYLGEAIALPIHLFASSSTEPEAAPEEPAEAEAPRTTGRPSKGRGPVTTGDALRDGVYRQLDGMGWEVVVTVRCPFDFVTQGPSRGEKELLLTGVGSLRTAQHRAEVLQQLAKVAEGHSFYVVREAGSRASIDGLAILTMHELRRHRDRGELIDLIAEREVS